MSGNRFLNSSAIPFPMTPTVFTVLTSVWADDSKSGLSTTCTGTPVSYHGALTRSWARSRHDFPLSELADHLVAEVTPCAANQRGHCAGVVGRIRGRVAHGVSQERRLELDQLVHIHRVDEPGVDQAAEHAA